MQDDFEKRIARIKARRGPPPLPSAISAPPKPQAPSRDIWERNLRLGFFVASSVLGIAATITLLSGTLHFMDSHTGDGNEPQKYSFAQTFSVAGLTAIKDRVAQDYAMSRIFYLYENGKVTREEAMAQWIEADLELPREFKQRVHLEGFDQK
jgi:hypothetical protein